MLHRISSLKIKRKWKSNNRRSSCFWLLCNSWWKQIWWQRRKRCPNELGKDLFLKDFDGQLVGVKKGDEKIVDATLPANHPKKDLANKKTKFICKISNIKKPKESKIDDDFAKKMGAKDLKDLNLLIEKQISNQYLQALNSITKKEILDQIENTSNRFTAKPYWSRNFYNDTKFKTRGKRKHKVNNEKLAKSRIKLGLLLNEYGEKNNLKVTDDEVRAEIQKQIRGMPGRKNGFRIL